MSMIEFIEEVARRGGAEAMSYFNHVKEFRVKTKSTPKDLVSTADVAVESVVVGMIKERFPDHGIFSEECGVQAGNSDYQWVIDPIDGTQSFVKGHPYFSVSIALKERGETLAGCVFGPALDVMFSGEVGKGAFENGRPLQVSSCTSLAESACATGFACIRAGLKQNNLTNVMTIVPQLRDIKRCGSAALDLGYVAAGTYECFWEWCLSEYDVAAGVLLCKLAGGKVVDWFDGQDYPQKGIVAGSAAIVDQLRPQLIPCE